MVYPSWFYYYAMLSNLILRFTWALNYVEPYLTRRESQEALIFFLGIADLFRRAQWCLIRLENEQIHNIDSYRTILAIPAVKEVVDDEE